MTVPKYEFGYPFFETEFGMIVEINYNEQLDTYDHNQRIIYIMITFSKYCKGT